LIEFPLIFPKNLLPIQEPWSLGIYLDDTSPTFANGEKERRPARNMGRGGQNVGQSYFWQGFFAHFLILQKVRPVRQDKVSLSQNQDDVNYPSTTPSP